MPKIEKYNSNIEELQYLTVHEKSTQTKLHKVSHGSYYNRKEFQCSKENA